MHQYMCLASSTTLCFNTVAQTVICWPIPPVLHLRLLSTIAALIVVYSVQSTVTPVLQCNHAAHHQTATSQRVVPGQMDAPATCSECKGSVITALRDLLLWNMHHVKQIDLLLSTTAGAVCCKKGRNTKHAATVEAVW